MMRKTLQYILWLVLAPLSIWAGYLLAGDRGTAFAVGALVVLSLLPFFLRFEKAKHSGERSRRDEVASLIALDKELIKYYNIICRDSDACSTTSFKKGMIQNEQRNDI